MRLRILLDECVHAGVRAAFPGHAVKTVTESGWRSAKDGQLHKYRLGFVVVRVLSNRLHAFLPLFDELLTAAASVHPGEVIHIGLSKRRR